MTAGWYTEAVGQSSQEARDGQDEDGDQFLDPG